MGWEHIRSPEQIKKRKKEMEEYREYIRRNRDLLPSSIDEIC